MKLSDWRTAIAAGEFRHHWAPLRIEQGGHVLELFVSAQPAMMRGIYRSISGRDQQLLADELGAVLLTARLYEERWAAAGVKLRPHPGNIRKRSDADHTRDVEADLRESGVTMSEATIVAEIGKTWIADAKDTVNVDTNHGMGVPRGEVRWLADRGDGKPGHIWNGPKPHQRGIPVQPAAWLKGAFMIQVRGGAHSPDHGADPDGDGVEDYSQGAEFALDACALDGKPDSLARLYADPKLCALVTHDGRPVPVRQPGVNRTGVASVVEIRPEAPKVATENQVATADWRTGFTDDGFDLSTRPLGQRCLAWLGFQFGLDPREIPGPRHNPVILAYSRHCRRGGRFLGVDAGGAPLWEGGVSVALQSDDSGDPWCAAIASATLLAAILAGEVPPHGARVSVRELVEDARASGALRPIDWTPTPGALMIEARSGEDPLTGGRGHVRRVVKVEGDEVLCLGGNEQDRIVCARHPMRGPALRAWIDVDAKPGPKPEKLPAAATPASPADIASALRAAWPDGSAKARTALLAQILHETANGQRIRAHNVGNARAKPGGPHCWTFFQTYEFFAPAKAAAYVRAAKPRTDGVVGQDCEFGATQPDGQQRVNFFPSSIGACFRAFRSLDEGVADLLSMLRKGFPRSWQAAQSGDVAAFARALHAEHYFTASPASYEAAMVRLSAQFAGLS